MIVTTGGNRVGKATRIKNVLARLEGLKHKYKERVGSNDLSTEDRESFCRDLMLIAKDHPIASNVIEKTCDIVRRDGFRGLQHETEKH